MENSGEVVTITRQEYLALLESDAHLTILFHRGVDNWQGYCGTPYRPAKMTDEEYQKVLEAWCEEDEDIW